MAAIPGPKWDPAPRDMCCCYYHTARQNLQTRSRSLPSSPMGPLSQLCVLTSLLPS